MGHLTMPRPNTRPLDMTYWWVHTVTVERYLREGQGGTEVYADAEQVDGFYQDKERLVIGPEGDQILAAGTFYFADTVAYVPLQSRVTLPAAFGGRVVTVVSVSVVDTGPLPFANYQEVGLL